MQNSMMGVKNTVIPINYLRDLCDSVGCDGGGIPGGMHQISKSPIQTKKPMGVGCKSEQLSVISFEMY